MRLAFVSTQLLLTQALRLAPGAKPRLATGGLTVLTPAAAHAASATYDFGYRLERAIDPDKRGPSDDSAVSDIMASMCNPPMPAVDPAPALSHTDAAASGIASSTALAAQPAMATVPSAKVAASHNPSPHPSRNASRSLNPKPDPSPMIAHLALPLSPTRWRRRRRQGWPPWPRSSPPRPQSPRSPPRSGRRSRPCSSSRSPTPRGLARPRR